MYNNSSNIPIVSGQVIKADSKKGLTVKLEDGRIGTVDIDQISDINIGSIQSYFNLFPKYKFKILKNKHDDNLKLSYKLCHPKLVRNKRKIIPTCNHFSTLKRMIWFEIYLYDKQYNINELSNNRLDLEFKNNLADNED